MIPLGLLPDGVPMFDVIGLADGIVDSSDDDESPREQGENLAGDQDATAVRVVSDKGVVWRRDSQQQSAAVSSS